MFLSRAIFGALIITISLPAIGCDRFRSAFRQDTVPEAEKPSPSSTPLLPSSIHLAFGNPSNATEDAENDENYLIVDEGSAFSYNNVRGTANWVSWKTTRADLGKSIERPDFRPDPRLPDNFRRIGYYDYSGSGYDRGHMVPSADRFANAALNEQTFMMTNIVPQTGALNQYPWNKLEQYARVQTRKFDVYQIAGVYGEQRRLKGKVTAPTNCWKLIMLIPKGRPVDGIDERTRFIVVDMPNIEGIENVAWEKYRTSIRSIEEKTGYDFLHFLPRQLQEKIETRVEMQSK